MSETAKMPERIWALEKHGPYRLSCSVLDHSHPEYQAVEYVRAELVADLVEALRGILSNPGGRCTAEQWQAGLRALAKAEGCSDA